MSIRTRNFLASLEAIDYQDGSLHAAMTDLLEKHRDDLDAVREKIPQLVMDKTGLLFKVNFHRGHIGDVSVSLPLIDPANPLTPPMLEWYTGTMSKDADEFFKGNLKLLEKGTIDLKKGRVGGDFSKLEHKLNLPRKILKSDVTSKIISAIILHEVGHAFTFIEFITEGYAQNIILGNQLREFSKCKSKEEAVVVLNRLNKSGAVDKTPLQERMIEQASSASDIHYYAVTMGAKKTLLNQCNKYFVSTSSEAAADQWAVRQGAGEDIAAGLTWLYDKLPRGGSAWQNFSPFGLVAAVGLLVVTKVVAMSDENKALLMTIESNALAMLIGISKPTYDNDRERIERIYREVIGQLKDAQLDEQSKRTILKHIEGIQECLKKKLNDRAFHESGMGGFTQLIINMVPAIMQGNSIHQLEQLLEKLTNNELYIMAAKYDTAQ